MKERLNLTGQTFGRLTVLSEAPSRKNPGGTQHRYWLCQCSCGKKKEIATGCLRSGRTVSCGCWARDMVRIEGERMAAAFAAAREYWTGKFSKAPGGEHEKPGPKKIKTPSWCKKKEEKKEDERS